MVAFVVYDPAASGTSKPVLRYGDCPAEDVTAQGGAYTAVQVAEGQMQNFRDAAALIESPLWTEGTIHTMYFVPSSGGIFSTTLSPAGPSALEVDAIRAQLLADSDWTQLLDAPLTATKQAQWATYRQALRDIPAQPGYPSAVSWPTKPT